MVGASNRNRYVELAYWSAGGLAAAGGLAPIVLTLGHAGRLVTAILAFAVATMIMCAQIPAYRRGQTYATWTLVAGGVTLVYAALALVALPVRLAAVGACPAGVVCRAGLESSLTGGESTSVGAGIAFAVLSLCAALVGLVQVTRARRRAIPQPEPVD